MLGPWDLNPSAAFYLNPLFPHPTHRQESEPEMTGSFSSFHSQPKCHGLKIELLGGGNARRVCSRHTGLFPWVHRGSAALQPDGCSQRLSSALEPDHRRRTEGGNQESFC